MSKSTITVAGINPSLYILGATQQLNFSQNLSTLQINNNYIPTSLVSSQTILEFRNNLLSGFRFVHNTSNTDTYGSLTLQSFVNASSIGANLITINNSGVNINSGRWQGSPIELGYGGTGASLTASPGGIFYSTASAAAILAAGTSGQVLTSAGSSAPIWKTAFLSGFGTLNGTTGALVNVSGVTTSSIINITRNNGATIGAPANTGNLSVGNITDSSFTVYSSNSSDSSPFNWQVINP